MALLSNRTYKLGHLIRKGDLYYGTEGVLVSKSYKVILSLSNRINLLYCHFSRNSRDLERRIKK